MGSVSQCSTCAEAGLTEAQCVRGDCHDGCGDCRDTAVAVGQVDQKCRICGQKLAQDEFARNGPYCDRCEDEGDMIAMGNE